MPISTTDQLFKLIKSLTRSEKRNFRIYAQRMSEGNTLLYLNLFDVLDKQVILNEGVIKDRFGSAQLPNLKRHLYSQILISLRHLERKKSMPMMIREYLDFANILYGKGLYLQSLKILEKAKKLANKQGDDMLFLQILEFQKIIESRHITRTGPSIAPLLTEETNEHIQRLNNRLNLSNLRLLLHSWYVQYGHVRSEDMANNLKNTYKDALKNIPVENLGLVEKAYYYQAKVWYHYTLLEFDACYKASKNGLNLLKTIDDHSQQNYNLRMRAYHYALTSLYYLQKEKKYLEHLKEFEIFRKSGYKKFDRNTQITSFRYVHNGRLNKFLLTKAYADGVQVIPKTLTRIRKYRSNLDKHHILVLYYKIALLYLMGGQADEAIKYLHDIVNTKMGDLREDIQAYARLTFLMAHYDAGNMDLLAYLTKQTKKYIVSSSIHTQMPVELINFFERIMNKPTKERKQDFLNFGEKINQLSSNKYEQRSIAYLHIEEWIKTKI